jgi:hypothetical protein
MNHADGETDVIMSLYAIKQNHVAPGEQAVATRATSLATAGSSP